MTRTRMRKAKSHQNEPSHLRAARRASKAKLRSTQSWPRKNKKTLLKKLGSYDSRADYCQTARIRRTLENLLFMHTVTAILSRPQVALVTANIWRRTISTRTVVLISLNSGKHMPMRCLNPTSPCPKASLRAPSATKWNLTRQTGLCANRAHLDRLNQSDPWQLSRSLNKKKEIRSPRRSWLADRMYRSLNHRSNLILKLQRRETSKSTSKDLERQAETPETRRNLNALVNDQIDRAMLPRDLLDSRL